METVIVMQQQMISGPPEFLNTEFRSFPARRTVLLLYVRFTFPLTPSAFPHHLSTGELQDRRTKPEVAFDTRALALYL